VATFSFNSPAAGVVDVTASFQVRVHNGASDCHVESQLATAPATIGNIAPGSATPAGFIDQWVNQNLPTQNLAGTYLGLNASVSRVFSVVAGSNTIYLNGQFNGYGGTGPNCSDAMWGPINVSAVFANQNPSSSLTVP
jgi:hypothetical protein